MLKSTPCQRSTRLSSQQLELTDGVGPHTRVCPIRSDNNFGPKQAKQQPAPTSS